MTALMVSASDLATLDPHDPQPLRIFSAGPDDLASLRLPAARRLVSLGAQWLDAPALQALFALDLPNLSRLSFIGGALDPAALAALGRSPVTAQVTSLVLTGPVGGGPAAESLAGSPLFARLESLEFADGDCGDAGCLALARAAERGRLRHLVFGRFKFGIPGDVNNSEVTCRGVEHLLGSAALAGLEELKVALVAIEAPLARKLLGSPLARFVWLFPGSWTTRREAPAGGGCFEFQASGELPDGPPEGPYHGRATLSDGRSFEGCGGGAVFSADGSLVAFPVWERRHGALVSRSRVRVVRLGGGAVTDLPETVPGSLTLFSLEADRVRGVASLEDGPVPFEGAL